jgi:diaminopimelate decarboxylase
MARSRDGFDGNVELDMVKLGEEFVELMTSVCGDRLLAGSQFLLEIGRYLVGNQGSMSPGPTTVRSHEERRSSLTGLCSTMAAAGSLGHMMKRNCPSGVVDRLGENANAPVTLIEPVCTPLDTLARDVKLSPTRGGDLAGVCQSGVCTLTASAVQFLSHPAPAEVLVQERPDRLIGRVACWSTAGEGDEAGVR